MHFTARCYTECGYATLGLSSVRLSVRDVQVPWSHRLEYFENNHDRLAQGLCSARLTPQHGRSSATGTPQNSGGIGVGSWAQKPAISPKRCEIKPRLLWRTNKKSHTRFRLVPKSMTLLAETHSCGKKHLLRSPPEKKLNKDRPRLSAAKCKPMILVSRNIRHYAEICWGSSGRGFKRQWGCRRRHFLVISVTTPSATLERRPALLYGDKQSVAGL